MYIEATKQTLEPTHSKCQIIDSQVKAESLEGDAMHKNWTILEIYHIELDCTYTCLYRLSFSLERSEKFPENAQTEIGIWIHCIPLSPNTIILEDGLNWSWVGNDTRPMADPHFWRKASLNSGFQKLTHKGISAHNEKSNKYIKNKPLWTGIKRNKRKDKYVLFV